MRFPPVLMLLVPAAYLVAALLPERLFVRSPERRWMLALVIASSALVLALIAGGALTIDGARVESLDADVCTPLAIVVF